MHDRKAMPTPGPDGPRTLAPPGWEMRPQERVLLVRGGPAKVGSRAFESVHRP